MTIEDLDANQETVRNGLEGQRDSLLAQQKYLEAITDHDAAAAAK